MTLEGKALLVGCSLEQWGHQRFCVHYFIWSSHLDGCAFIVFILKTRKPRVKEVTCSCSHVKWKSRIFKNKNFFNVCLFLRDRVRQTMSGEGRRERETQNLKQAPGSELSAQRLWPEPKSAAHPGAPKKSDLKPDLSDSKWLGVSRADLIPI